MEKLLLPHRHGNHDNDENLYSELMKINRFNTAAEIFKQLSDTTRLRIFWLLSHEEECVINIAAWLKISSPAVSHHLRSLSDCGLVTSRRVGKEVYYKTSDAEESRLLHKAVEKVMEIACPEDVAQNQKSVEETIKKIHDYLAENLADRITIDELSKKYLLNSTTLKKKFKDMYGLSLAAHIKMHRMHMAQKLLTQTDLSVSQISNQVGYKNQSRFTIEFKNYFGILPSEYKKTVSNIEKK